MSQNNVITTDFMKYTNTLSNQPTIQPIIRTTPGNLKFIP